MLDLSRCSFGFHNPNHAAALVCALLPLCWDWQRHVWVGRVLAVALVAMLLLTQSRTGFLVAGLEAVWWWLRNRRTAHVSRRRWWSWVVAGFAVAGLAFWWLGPRLVLDDSILNRPKIWLAGLQLFAANPGGVGLGNSGTLVSAFLVDEIPDVRTLVNAHITLLAEFGWLVGWAWGAFIVLALTGLKESPRIGLAFAGLVASGCSSTVFDWAVLFDFAERGGLGWTNWGLSWGMFAFFVGYGAWLVGGRSKLRPSRLGDCGGTAREGRNLLRSRVLAAPVCSGVLVLAAWLLVPPGDAPRVRDGYALSGGVPRTLALYDGTWRLRTVRPCVGRDAVVPIRPVSRFPHGIDLSGVGRVVLFGTCREWAYLVKGVEVSCVED